jgi:protein gp37
VSYEPALGDVSWDGWEFIKWLVSDGESGEKARPSHPNWHIHARDFCVKNRIAYFFKQWGRWKPGHKGFQRREPGYPLSLDGSFAGPPSNMP